MIDIKWIRNNPILFDKALKKRGIFPKSQEIVKNDQQYRSIINSLEDNKSQQKALAKEIEQLIGSEKKEIIDRLKSKVFLLKSSFEEFSKEKIRLKKNIYNILSHIPNIPLEDVPLGKNENDNIEIRNFKKPEVFNFKPKTHYELGKKLKGMHFDLASIISGKRFTVLSGNIARLERSIGQFMIDLHTSENGYEEISPPLLVHDHAIYGTAQLPKFSEDLFQTKDGRWLIPTSEVSLTNLVREKIIDFDILPLRFTAITPCFRSEAGSAGRDNYGIFRQHQFWKVEMVSITDHNSSNQELERMTKCAEEVLKRLQIPFRTVILCSGELGFAACKTYDIEVWLPGQRDYKEISSCSTCGDFQARRMHARYRKKNHEINFVHTLNGSGLAIGRCLIAIMENYQQEDGSIMVPDVLRSYMGCEIIRI